MLSTTRVRKRRKPLDKTTFPIGNWQYLQETANPFWVNYLQVQHSPSPPFATVEMIKDQINPGPPYISGGPFTLLKARLGNEPRSVEYFPRTKDRISDSFGNKYRRYVGSFEPVWDFDPDTSAYSNNAQAFGSYFIPAYDSWSCKVDKALRPRLAKAGLAQAVVEAREIPSMLRQTSKTFSNIWRSMLASGSYDLSRVPKLPAFMQPKQAADDFLNYQFGWVPFVKDVTDFLKVSIGAREYMDELTSKNSKWEHREATLLIEESRTQLADQDGWKVNPTGFLIQSCCNVLPSGQYGHYTTSYLDYVKIWCSGDYKFYRPEFDISLPDYHSKWNEVQRMLMLYGLRVDPSTIYKVTPWTWLIDWFANVGDTIDSVNAAALDGVVSKNLFVMHQRYRVLRLEQTVNFASGARTFVFDRIVETKQRMTTGNPFGFCLPDGLSAKQISILVALGLTKKLPSTYRA